MSPLNELPKWATIRWDDGAGWQYRRGFLTEYEHIERTPLVREIYSLPRVTISDSQDLFRYVINGEEIIIGPTIVEIITILEEA